VLLLSFYTINSVKYTLFGSFSETWECEKVTGSNYCLECSNEFGPQLRTNCPPMIGELFVVYGLIKLYYYSVAIFCNFYLLNLHLAI
jgi:hypothetical protein